MNIVLTGSVAFDYLMSFPGYFKDHILPDHLDSISLSFLVESMVRLRGGIAPNIAYTLALLGEKPHLWATVGEDFEEYRQWLNEHGIDTSGVRVIPGEYTASFFANIDRANAQIASFYPGAMAYAVKHPLHNLSNYTPDLVIISPNDPAAMCFYVKECQELNFPYIYDPSQQIVRLTSDDICQGLQGALALFVNEYEYALVQNMTHLTTGEILKDCQFMVVTQGEHGSTIYTDGKRIDIPIVPPEHIIDPTGVGDAFRAGFLSGYSHNLDLETCGRMGTLAATYCLEQRGTQTHNFTPNQFVARFRQYFDDQGKLNILIGE
jgi:adenosine kinase